MGWRSSKVFLSPSCRSRRCPWWKTAQRGSVQEFVFHLWRCSRPPVRDSKWIIYLFRQFLDYLRNKKFVLNHLRSLPLHVGDELLQKSGRVHFGSNSFNLSLQQIQSHHNPHGKLLACKKWSKPDALQDNCKMIQDISSCRTYHCIRHHLVGEEGAECGGVLHNQGSDRQEGQEQHVHLGGGQCKCVPGSRRKQVKE